MMPKTRSKKLNRRRLSSPRQRLPRFPHPLLQPLFYLPLQPCSPRRHCCNSGASSSSSSRSSSNCSNRSSRSTTKSKRLTLSHSSQQRAACNSRQWWRHLVCNWSILPTAQTMRRLKRTARYHNRRNRRNSNIRNSSRNNRLSRLSGSCQQLMLIASRMPLRSSRLLRTLRMRATSRHSNRCSNSNLSRPQRRV